MFEYLKDFDIILLAGPHRSGTTIASNMIAHDLGYKLFHEEDVAGKQAELFKRKNLPIPNDWLWFIEWQKENGIEKFVIQCPVHCHMLTYYAGNSKIACVMLKRNVDDIIASQKRIGWGFEGIEKQKYRSSPNVKSTPLSVIKYKQWDEVQKPILEKTGQAFEIEYESLSAHDMWVNKESRVDFHTRQIKVGKPIGDKNQGYKGYDSPQKALKQKKITSDVKPDNSKQSAPVLKRTASGRIIDSSVNHVIPARPRSMSRMSRK